MKVLPDFLILILIYLFVFYPQWKAKGRYTLFTRSLMYIYLTFVLYFTLMPIIASLPSILNHTYRPMNLTPFIDVTTGRGDYQRQIILNVIMTIPFGFLLPLVQTKPPTLLKTLLYTFLLSFSIEIIQPLISSLRSSDITDIITNVLGGILGYSIYLLFQPLLTKLLSRLQKPPKSSPSQNFSPLKFTEVL